MNDILQERFECLWCPKKIGVTKHASKHDTHKLDRHKLSQVRATGSWQSSGLLLGYQSDESTNSFQGARRTWNTLTHWCDKARKQTRHTKRDWTPISGDKTLCIFGDWCLPGCAKSVAQLLAPRVVSAILKDQPICALMFDRGVPIRFVLLVFLHMSFTSLAANGI